MGQIYPNFYHPPICFYSVRIDWKIVCLVIIRPLQCNSVNTAGNRYQDGKDTVKVQWQLQTTFFQLQLQAFFQLQLQTTFFQLQIQSQATFFKLEFQLLTRFFKLQLLLSSSRNSITISSTV